MKKINNLINYLNQNYNLNTGYFCIYGSYATNTQNHTSDIDLLYIDSSIKKPSRASVTYKNIEISLYKISEKILIDDSNGKYGGYFCGKIFNPHILVLANKENKELINTCIAQYFSNILDESFCKLDKKYTADDILKTSIKIYIDIYPEFFAYIMRLYKMDNFNDVWKKWRDSHVLLLVKAGLIKEKNNFYYYQSNVFNQIYKKTTSDYIARFWIFGAVSHNSDLSFYDYYKNKNVKYISNNPILKKHTEEFLNYTYYFRKENKT